MLEASDSSQNFISFPPFCSCAWRQSLDHLVRKFRQLISVNIREMELTTCQTWLIFFLPKLLPSKHSPTAIFPLSTVFHHLAIPWTDYGVASKVDMYTSLYYLTNDVVTQRDHLTLQETAMKTMIAREMTQKNTGIPRNQVCVPTVYADQFVWKFRLLSCNTCQVKKILQNVSGKRKCFSM